MAAEGHALLSVNQKRVCLHFDIVLKTLLVLEQFIKSTVGLSQFVLHVLDAVHQLVHLLQQLAVWTVVAILNLGSTSSFLEASLSDPQWGVLSRNRPFDALNVPFHFRYFLNMWS